VSCKQSQGSPEHNATWRTMHGVSEQCTALHKLILNSRASTISDAVAQLLQIDAIVSELEAFLPDSTGFEQEIRFLQLALSSAVPVIAKAANVDLEKFGGGDLIRRSDGGQALELPQMEAAQ
jgi:hypothetical protein